MLPIPYWIRTEQSAPNCHAFGCKQFTPQHRVACVDCKCICYLFNVEYLCLGFTSDHFQDDTRLLRGTFFLFVSTQEEQICWMCTAARNPTFWTKTVAMQSTWTPHCCPRVSLSIVTSEYSILFGVKTVIQVLTKNANTVRLPNAKLMRVWLT